MMADKFQPLIFTPDEKATLRTIFSAAQARTAPGLVDTARAAVEALRAVQEGGMPSGEDDPRLDELAQLMHAGYQLKGFTAELRNQMTKAGLEVPAETWAQLAILAAKRR